MGTALHQKGSFKSVVRGLTLFCLISLDKSDSIYESGRAGN